MRLRYFESSPSMAIGPTPQVSINSNTQKERTMRRLSIAFALSTLLLATICSAQQTAQNTPANPAQQDPGSPPPLPTNPILGGGTVGTLGVFTEFNNQHTIMGASPAAVVPSCLGFPGAPGCITTPDPLVSGGADVEGSNAFYEIFADPVLSIGSEASDQNIFAGVNAGTNNVSESGVNNAFFGFGAGNANTAGAGNTFLGLKAGNSNTVGIYNTYVGYRAAVNNIGSYNTYLGYETGLDQSSESNTLRLGARDNTLYTYISGIANTPLTNGVEVVITPGDQLGVLPSSLRFKEQVYDMGDSTSNLMKLRPVTFFYKPEYENGQRTLQYGLNAEEVAKVYPELVAYDKDGKPYAVRYQYITTMLLNEVQKQYHRAETQTELIKAQQQEIDGLKQQLQVQNATLQERLSRLEALARVERAAAH